MMVYIYGFNPEQSLTRNVKGHQSKKLRAVNFRNVELAVPKGQRVPNLPRVVKKKEKYTFGVNTDASKMYN